MTRSTGRRRTGVAARVITAVAVAAVPLPAQSIADRVTAVRDGAVEMTFAARPDACGNGGDVVALGRLITVYPSMRGHGWSNADCWFGPVRAVITKRDGEVTAIRAHVGAARRSATGAVTLGAVAAPAAAAYFLDLAPRLHGRAASTAIMAAAVADSADVWQRLLDIARDERHSRDLRSSALYWVAGTAPPEAAAPLTSLARSGSESRTVREGALATLAQLRDHAGTASLIEMTRRDDAEHWLRERAIFWLGNAADDRGRETLRSIAASDTVPARFRDQAIFALGHLDQHGENGPFLRQLFTRLDHHELRAKIIQSAAQLDDAATERWLLDLVRDASQPLELRKQALFWRGQRASAPLDDLIALYPRLGDRELREHYIFVLSQRRESDAVEKLIDLARNDPDRAMRHKAIFWLGQSRDPRAAKFLAEAIEK